MGFKILYHQAATGGISKVWQFLAQRRDIKVIHIVRENWLASLVSKERAKATGIWHSVTPQKPCALKLEPDKCLAHFELHEKRLKLFQTLFEGHEMLTLQYGDILRSFTDVIGRISGFLGVDTFESCEPAIVKIATVPLSSEVKNFYALREFFANSRYVRFFHET